MRLCKCAVLTESFLVGQCHKVNPMFLTGLQILVRVKEEFSSQLLRKKCK